MAGTSIQVRAAGIPDSLEEALRVQYNKVLDDLETIRSAVVTANGGTITLPASALVASKINAVYG